MPTPGSESNSRWACSKTGTGSTAGPGEKLKTRSVMEGFTSGIPQNTMASQHGQGYDSTFRALVHKCLSLASLTHNVASADQSGPNWPHLLFCHVFYSVGTVANAWKRTNNARS